MIKVAEEEKPPDIPEEEVGRVVEKAHEEIEEKKEEKNNNIKGADYQAENSDYKTYESEIEVPGQFAASSEDIAVDEDISLHQFRKSIDPREHIKKGKYTKPWDNMFLNYIKDGLRDRAKRVSAMTKRGFKSAKHNVTGVYHSIHGWVYRKK